MDLLRGIFKQKITAFLLFFEVFPEYIQKPLSTKVENNSTSAVCSSNPEKRKEKGWGGGFWWGHQILQDAGRA